MPFSSSLFWALLLLCNGFIIVVFALNDEGVSLLSFKKSIREDPDGALANWNSSDGDPCSWNGITCRESKVVSLTIPKKRLLGTIDPAIGLLPFLRHINLRSNKLLGSLPAGLFRARGLQSLVLSGNSLSGYLTNEIGYLSYLQVLDLSHNSLNGSIPISLMQCKRLKTLDLSNNNFTNSLPDDFGSSLGSLEELNLSHNRLNGSIPSGIGNLSSIQGVFDLSHNLFSGAIPASLGNLPEKVYIDVAYNNLSGPIPHNGSMMNRGLTAFIGNPGLCGPPLGKLCSSSVTGIEANTGRSSKSISIKRSVVIAFVVSDVIVILLFALVFFYCYRRSISSKKEEGGNSYKVLKESKECWCFQKDESETFSESFEQLDIVPLDHDVNFNLDQLLKSTAIVLGKSSIGIVYKVVLDNGLTMAVRRLGDGGAQRFKEFQREVEAIGKVRHSNIVALRAYYWSMEEKLLVYDYIPNGNLSTAIHGEPGKTTFRPLTWNVRLEIMKGAAKGLAFLHEFSPKKYIHGDLKPNNILLGTNMQPLISDFGVGYLANLIEGFRATHRNRVATEKPQNQLSDASVSPVMDGELCYQAPEAFKTLKSSQKWDVYSFGVILIELISGRTPIVQLDSSEMDIVRWIQFCIQEKKPLSDVLDPFLSQESEQDDEVIAVLKVALACVQYNPERRPSMRHIAEILDGIAS